VVVVDVVVQGLQVVLVVLEVLQVHSILEVLMAQLVQMVLEVLVLLGVQLVLVVRVHRLRELLLVPFRQRQLKEQHLQLHNRHPFLLQLLLVDLPLLFQLQLLHKELLVQQGQHQRMNMPVLQGEEEEEEVGHTSKVVVEEERMSTSLTYYG